MKKYLLASSLLTFLFLLSSCSIASVNGKGIKGDKNIVEKTISISEYNSIEFLLAGDIHYEQNETEPAYLKIEIDSNLLDELDIKVTGETLRFGTTNNSDIRPSKFIIYTNSKTLNGISVSGVAKVYARNKVKTENLKLNVSGVADLVFDNLEAQETTFNVSGVGNVDLVGTSNSSSYNISGTGNINAREFIVTTVDCKVSGMGNITVNAKDKLDASISGMGDIRYIGTPANVSQSVSGMGKIKSIK